MNESYELLVRTLVNIIEYRFDIDDYDYIQNLEQDIVCEKEEIITDCLDMVDGFFIEDFSEYAYRYLVTQNVTKEELLEIIRKPVLMFRCACYYALDNAISKVINNFIEAKERE